MDVQRQQLLGTVVNIIDTLRNTANALEAQMNTIAPGAVPNMTNLPMFQLYNPNGVPTQLHQQQHQMAHQQPHPQQQQPMLVAQTGGGRKRSADGVSPVEGGPKRRRRRNQANDDASLENGVGGGRRKKAPVDPNRPKRPASAYLVFQNEIRKEMQAAFPDKPYHEILGKISERWNQLREPEKQHYIDITNEQKVQYAKDKARYDAEMAAKGNGAQKIETNGAGPGVVMMPTNMQQPPVHVQATVPPVVQAPMSSLAAPPQVAIPSGLPAAAVPPHTGADEEGDDDDDEGGDGDEDDEENEVAEGVEQQGDSDEEDDEEGSDGGEA